jgi:hypothetical protein
MKKTILFLSLFVFAITGLKAQCTITPGCTVGANGYCSTPANGGNLPNATEQVAYSTVIQVSIGTTIGPATINNATLVSVTGLPTGLTYAVNPSSGVINGGSNGCLLISGTPAIGTSGTYTVTANVTVNTNFGSSAQALTWTLVVSTTTGITELSKETPNLAILPNPAKTELNLTANFQFQSIHIFNTLGKLVLTQEIKGTNKTTIALDMLNPGIYFLQITDGNKVITRKFIKE